MGPAWVPCHKEWAELKWIEFKCPKLKAALASWSSSWGSGDHHFAVASTNTSALPRKL